jgi:hypothetical protein
MRAQDNEYSSSCGSASSPQVERPEGDLTFALEDSNECRYITKYRGDRLVRTKF